jgi:uncharacterized protein involved in type VI secretion and phage assembly
VAERFPGKHVAVVADNDDPKKLSRLKVKVPEILGEQETGWCLPCSPYAGAGIGLAAVPPVGSLVFVEWPAGDVTRPPIWAGATWADGDGVEGADPDALVLVTPSGHRIFLNDASGDEAIEVAAASGAKLTLDADGVLVEFGGQKIAVTRSSVSINDGALEIK